MPRAKSFQLYQRTLKRQAVEHQGCHLCGAGRIPEDLARYSPQPPYNPRSYILDGDPMKEPVTVICRRCHTKARRAANGTLGPSDSARLLQPPEPPDSKVQ